MQLAAAVDPALADLSNKLVYSAMAVYLLAMLAYCAEWTFGSRGAIARRSAAQADGAGAVPAARTPLAEAAAVSSGARARTVTVTVAEPGGGTREVTRTALAGDGAAVVTSGRGDGAEDGAGAAGTDEQADLVGRVAVSLTALACLLHAGGVLSRGLSASRWPWGNMYEFSCAFALAAVVAFLGLLAAGQRVRWLGLPVVVAVLLTLGLAVTVLYTEAQQLVPALHSYWIAIHVSAAIVCGGAFYAAFAATVLYLFKDGYERRVADGGTGGRLATVWRRVPAAATLDKLSYRINALVFPLWTFTIVAGAIWAEAAWGRYWNWDPKETWSFITWVAYAAYLHARATAGWKGRKAAWLALIAFACFLFNYYGVNMFVTGTLHGYAGVE